MQAALPNHDSISAITPSSSPTRSGDQNQCLPTAACSPSGPPSGVVAFAASGSVWLGITRCDGSSDAVSGVPAGSAPAGSDAAGSASTVPGGSGSSPEPLSVPPAEQACDEEEGVSLGTRRMLQAVAVTLL